MSGSFVNYAGEADTGRGQSFALWNPVMDAIVDILGGNFSRGIFVQDDFLDLSSSASEATAGFRYTWDNATAGTLALDDAEGGVVLVDCNSTTADQGIQVQQKSGTVGEFIAPEAGKDLYFECRVKFADIATGPNAFIGLHESDLTILAAGDIDNGAADAFVGFRISEALNASKAVQGVTGNLTSRTLTPAAGIHTLVDDTYVKLGFKVKGTSKVTFFVNGVASSDIITATIPTALMTLSAAIHSEGTTDPILHLDWWQVLKVLQGT